VLAGWVHFYEYRPVRPKTERHLTTLFGTVESAEIPVIEAHAAKKHGWLPLLTVLFMISYGLMTMLIVEQGRTIESQRNLIRELFQDSKELSAAKMKANVERVAPAQAQSPLKQAPSSRAQSPSTQSPLTQAPTNQTPSTQVGVQARTRNQAGKQKVFRMPSRPASDLSDTNRALITI